MKFLTLIFIPLMIISAIFFSGMNYSTGRKLIGHSEAMAVQLMVSSAVFALENIPPGSKLPPDSVLKKAADLFDIERVTIIDKYSIVNGSSSSLFSYMDDFADFHVDKTVFDSAMVLNVPIHTSLKKIDAEYFQALYYPFSSNNQEYCVVVESNRRHFSVVGSTKHDLFVNTIVLWSVMVALIISVTLLIKRHLNLQRVAQKQERLSFIGQTASELAHEIKNPLAIIKSSADVLQKRIDPEKKDLALNFIASETMRLSRTIDRVLNFASNKPLQKEFFNLQNILKTTTEPLKVKWPEIEFELLDDSTIELNGDKDAFKQILWNLIKNSAEAMNGKGKISISFIPPTLIFRDNGPGIPAKLRKSLFEPFVSAKTSGTGLGLAVVATLCEKHGWKIVLDNKHINGAAFMIKLPEETWRKS